MSTSCIIGLVECRTNDIEDIANYLVNNCMYDIAIYSHKYPHYVFIYVVDKKEFIEIEINPNIERISDCLPEIEKALKPICDFKTLAYFQPLY